MRSNKFPPCGDHGLLEETGICLACIKHEVAAELERSREAIAQGKCVVCLTQPAKLFRMCETCWRSGTDGAIEAAGIRAAGHCPVCCGIPSRAAEPHCHYCYTMHEEPSVRAVACLGNAWTTEVPDDCVEASRPCARCGGYIQLGSTYSLCLPCRKRKREEEAVAEAVAKGKPIRRCKECGCQMVCSTLPTCAACRYGASTRKKVRTNDKGDAITAKECKCGRKKKRTDALCEKCRVSQVFRCKECGAVVPYLHRKCLECKKKSPHYREGKQQFVTDMRWK